MVRNMAVVVVDPDGTERAVHRIQFGARMKVDEGDKIKRGQRIAEWDPYTRPILTEVDGTVAFEDLVEGQSMSRDARRVDRHRQARRHRLADVELGPRRRSASRHGRSRARTARSSSSPRGGDARYLLAVDAIISIDPGGKVKAGDVIARIPTESAKTRDITGGLPRVAELFEARQPKDAAIIAEISGTVRFGRDYKNKRRIIDRAEREGRGAARVPDPEGQAHPSAGRRRDREGRLHHRRQPGAARHPGGQGRRGTRGLSGQRDPGRLPAAGRADQRQAHRGDRPADAAEGGDRPTRARPT